MAEKKTKNTLVVVFRVLFSVFSVLTVVFIFSNSLDVPLISNGKSGTVTELFNRALVALGFSVQVPEGLVRKLAHMAEFAMLGFWLMLTLRVYTRRVLSHIGTPLFGGLFIAVMDEFLQAFVPGRSSAVTDVLIDFSGVVLGLLCALFLLLLTRMMGVLIKAKAEL